MTTLGATALVLASLLVLGCFYEWGRQNGYAAGSKAMDNWWLGVESAADEPQKSLRDARRGKL